jgi:hypothetical protein
MPQVTIKSTAVVSLFAGAFFVLSGAAAQAQDRWAAIAIDGAGHWGYAYGKPNRPSAESGALGGCGAPGCKIESAEQARCLAFAESRAGGYWYGMGYGATEDAVVSTAKGGCSAGAPAGTCQVLKVAVERRLWRQGLVAKCLCAFPSTPIPPHRVTADGFSRRSPVLAENSERTCTPLPPRRSSTRIMCPDSLVWMTMARRAIILDPR